MAQTKRRVPFYLYLLLDPRDDEVRYVGQAIDKDERLQRHLGDTRDFHVYRWIRLLKKFSLVPTMKIVVVVGGQQEANRVERALIRLWRSRGARLTNMTDGGEGMSGFKFSAESRKKMRDAKLGTVCSDETRERMSQAHQAKWAKLTPEERSLRASYGHEGHTHSKQTRAVLSAKVSALMTPEYREQLRQKSREGMLRYWAGIRQRAAEISRSA